MKLMRVVAIPFEIPTLLELYPADPLRYFWAPPDVTTEELEYQGYGENSLKAKARLLGVKNPIVKEPHEVLYEHLGVDPEVYYPEKAFTHVNRWKMDWLNYFKMMELKEIINDENYAFRVLEPLKDKIPKDERIVIGGEHSISWLSLKAYNYDHLIVLDSHPDSREDGPSNEVWLRKSLEEGITPTTVHVGSKTSDGLEYLKRNGVEVYTSEFIQREGFGSVIESLKNVEGHVLVSIDVDVIGNLNEGITPAYYYYNDRGPLSFRDVGMLLNTLRKKAKLSVDVTEYAPTLDKGGRFGCELARCLRHLFE